MIARLTIATTSDEGASSMRTSPTNATARATSPVARTIMRRLSIVYAVVVAVAGLWMLTPVASAGLSVIPPGGDRGFEAGVSTTQAGGHADASTSFYTTPDPTEQEFLARGGALRDVVVDLPPGVVGNPEAVDKCQPQQLQAGLTGTFDCPEGSQVGTVKVYIGLAELPVPSQLITVGLYAVEPAPDQLAVFAFKVQSIVVTIEASLRPDDYGVRLIARSALTFFPVSGTTVKVWGNPSDPAHDAERCSLIDDASWGFDDVCEGRDAENFPHPFTGERRAFFSNPTTCDGPKGTSIRVTSWYDGQNPQLSAPVTALTPTPTACERLAFDPALDIALDSTQPDSATGLSVGLSLPQNDDPDGLATAHLRDAEVTLPEGISINPSSADGLAGCSDAQLGLSTDSPVACPDASKIGTVSAMTPVLDDPVSGSVYVGTQNSDDPASGEMFRIFLVLNLPNGQAVKLPGKVRADAQTGRLETTFSDNPQLPVRKISLRLKSGPRAPLATPPTCGMKTTMTDLTSWAGRNVSVTDDLTIDCPGNSGFAPTFTAGSVNPTGGAFSPFTARISRPEREQYLSGATVDLPSGLIAKLRGVPLCGEFQAANGGCPAGSQIGTATVGAGSGSGPFHLQGPVYLTEGYKGGPYGLSTQVRVKAGPFDLGTVIVRQAIYVDPVTAELRVVSDPLPQIVKGVPARLRSVDVDVDRPEFTINPTSCAEKRVGAMLTAIDGALHESSSRFQVGDCQGLKFKPEATMRLTRKRQTRTGGHPGLRAVLTQQANQANVEMAKAILPRSLALDPKNSTNPKLVCSYDKGREASCPASSIIGNATATTPVLGRPLSGPVYLVQGIRFGSNGNRIRTLPTLLVTLRGDVAIDLRARSSVESGRLVTTFPSVPDAPVSRFTLRINGGRKGILVVTRTARRKIDICRGRHVADLQARGHNGKRREFKVRMGTPCKSTRR